MFHKGIDNYFGFGKFLLLAYELRPPVNEHVCGETTFVTTHMRKMKIRKLGDKKQSKTNNSNEKTGKAKHGSFPKLEDDYKSKGDAQEARSMYIQQLRKLSEVIQNNSRNHHCKHKQTTTLLDK